jgi:hypothetical protein
MMNISLAANATGTSLRIGLVSLVVAIATACSPNNTLGTGEDTPTTESQTETTSPLTQALI